MAAPEFKTYFQSFRTDEAGQVFMTGILNVEAFSKVNVAIVQASEAQVSIAAVCSMGKLSGETLAQPVAKFLVGITPEIHTFDVIGPEFSVILTGSPPNTEVSIQAWVFIH